jgi:hypothetical protein
MLNASDNQHRAVAEYRGRVPIPGRVERGGWGEAITLWREQRRYAAGAREGAAKEAVGNKPGEPAKHTPIRLYLCIAARHQ